jgi:hypothetical protein
VPDAPGGADDAGALPPVDPASLDASACQLCTVFVTTQTFRPGTDFSNVEAADDLCTRAANAPGVEPPIAGRRYVAWISASGHDVRARLGDAGPYVVPGGAVVAANTFDLRDGVFMTPLDRRIGGTQTVDTAAWTGTINGGVAADIDCLGWTVSSATEFGQVGQPTSTSPTWTSNGRQTCDQSHPLYCIEQ